MKGGTVQINWHDTKPVLACDFHPISGVLATAGADFDIKLWATVCSIDQEKACGVTYRSSLSYHGSAVNALRFSPSGEQLASGADGGELILWKSHITDAGEAWKVLKSLVFHHKDVLDLQWSNDGAYLISGSVDNSCIIWDANKGSVLQILDAHFHYVQGVAWDPLGQYAASLSSDRTCRVYISKPLKTKGVEKLNYVCRHVISKADSPGADESKSSRSHLFLDETLPSFFRRLAWSPDGSCLLVPAEGETSCWHRRDTVWFVYLQRSDWSTGCFTSYSQSPDQNVENLKVTRLFSIRESRQGQISIRVLTKVHLLLNPSILLICSQEKIFPVATLNSLYIYDTESIQPIVVVAGVHYAAITDIAWSPSGNYLVLSSQDGYCTLFEFENQELGSPMLEPEGTQVICDENKCPVVEGNNDISNSATVESRKEGEEEVENPPVMEKDDNKDTEEREENPLKEKDENKDRSIISPSTREPPSKPMRRRITPIAVD